MAVVRDKIVGQKYHILLQKYLEDFLIDFFYTNFGFRRSLKMTPRWNPILFQIELKYVPISKFALDFPFLKFVLLGYLSAT